MKNRVFKIALLSVLVVSLCLCGLSASADAPQPTQITAELRPSVTVVVDGVERTFYDVAGHEVHTIYYQGTHYLPVRAIGELMDKNVNWDGAAKTITLSSPRTAPLTTGTPDTETKDSNITVQLRPDISIVIDGVTKTFTDAAGTQVYPILNGGTNYLPVRAIGEMMGKTVSWDGQTRTITLSGLDQPLVTDADTFGPSAGTSGTGGTASGTLIGAEAAKAAALAHARLSADQVTFVKAKLDRENGRQIYEVEFYADGYREYDYEIDAYTGEILSFDYDAEEFNPPASGPSAGASGTGGTASGTLIGAEAAKAAALAHAKLSADQVTFVKAKLDREDGRQIYEVEFYADGYREYDYEIDAYTGEILSFDYDAEEFNPPAASSTSGQSYIGEERAKQIALAQVSGASASDIIKVELDHDDGNCHYEVKIGCHNMEYEFEINAYTGTILKWESEHHRESHSHH